MIEPPRIVVVAIVALIAAPAAASPLAPTDVVGTWRGAARWTGCTVPGDPQIALPIAWRDGRAVIDLAGARDDLGLVALDGVDGDALTGERDDLVVRFAPRARPTLTLTSSAGCVARATLTRTSTGIATCDRLVALAAIEAECPAAGDHRADRQASLRFGAWTGLRGARRRAAAATCATDADALAETLLDAGCLPGPAIGPGTGVPACDDYLAVLPRFDRCPGVSASMRATLDGKARELAQGLRQLRDPAIIDAQRETAARLCRDGTLALRRAAAAARCAL